MANNYIMLNMKDEKSGKIAEILANKTCKRILSLLADKNASESDIASELEIAINTAEYNIKKLVEAGLIEKAEHWWSVKGKKIPIYKLANKYIVIAPKTSSKILKNFVPVVLLSGIAAFFIRFFTQNNFNSQLARDGGDKFIEAAPQASGAVNSAVSNLGLWDKILAMPSWEWFLIGALFAILVFLILTIVRGLNNK
ncbi:MAG TPA: helix-turn-helix domain-containing protein [Candidatus Nanoarchaeia archaeon]|nr:helix-turn-helix domain-containing protein [Candidatus Nanoarchaeia archaeon]